MTYPDPRYHGDTGETSETYRPADHDPDVTDRNGSIVHDLATGGIRADWSSGVPPGDVEGRPGSDSLMNSARATRR